MYILFLVLAAFADDSVDIDAMNQLIGVQYQGRMYSGYLPVKNGEGQFHYMYYPSEIENAPLILWLNGGPGCSSLQGAVNENGPFVFKAGTSIFELNEHSWTKFARMLYIESPLNVGFSYGPTDLQSDESTAVYNLQALIKFLELYDFKGEVHIAGESYAGIYIPTLAAKIVDYNQNPTSAKIGKINLKSILVGNGCTHPDECVDYFDSYILDYYGRQGFVSDELYQKFLTVKDECLNSELPACQEISDQFDMEISGDGEFLHNPYNVYGYCFMPDNEAYQTRPFSVTKGVQDDDKLPPCADAVGLLKWFRDENFKTLIHIRPESHKWTVCSPRPQFTYQKDPKRSQFFMLPRYHLYPKLIQAGIRILKFSGDADAVVPITGTLAWIDLLQKTYNLPTISQWRPWFVPTQGPRAAIDGQQNAGNVWEIQGLTFISIKGAGHMVPLDKRFESFIFVKQWLSGTPFP